MLGMLGRMVLIHPAPIVVWMQEGIHKTVLNEKVTKVSV